MMGKFTLSTMFLIIGIFFFHCYILCNFFNLSSKSRIHSPAVPNHWNSSLCFSSQLSYFSPLYLILVKRLRSDTYFSLLDILFSSFPISLVSCDKFFILFLDSVIFLFILYFVYFLNVKNIFNILYLIILIPICLLIWFCCHDGLFSYVSGDFIIVRSYLEISLQEFFEAQIQLPV